MGERDTCVSGLGYPGVVFVHCQEDKRAGPVESCHLSRLCLSMHLAVQAPSAWWKETEGRSLFAFQLFTFPSANCCFSLSLFAGEANANAEERLLPQLVCQTLFGPKGTRPVHTHSRHPIGENRRRTFAS